MRRVTLAVMALAMAITGAIVTTAATPAGGAGIVDLSATSTSHPASVSPPGALVFYKATFTNEGAVPTPGTFTNTTTGGTVLSHTGDAACSQAGQTITCSLTLEANQTKVVDVVVQTPSTVGSTVTNTSKAEVAPNALQLVDLVAANNESTVVTPVQASTGVGSAGFVREGESLSYKKHVLTVRDAEVGVVAYLSDTVAPQARDCGGQPCQQGLHVDYDQNEQFFGTVQVDVNFGAVEPCRGLGNEECHPLFFQKPGSAVQPVPACTGGDDPVPCVERVYKDGAEFHHVVVMDTKDPDLLTPIKSLTSVRG